MERNQIIALVILVISILLIILKRYFVLSTWRKKNCQVLKRNKLSKTEFEIIYLYVIKGIKYQGRMIERFNNPNKKRKLYVHKLNPHLSVPDIPIVMSDICLIGLAGLSALYLYLYQCECLPEDVSNVLGIPYKETEMMSEPIFDTRRTF